MRTRNRDVSYFCIPRAFRVALEVILQPVRRVRPYLSEPRGKLHAALCAWPVPEPASWLRFVNAAQTEAELDAVRQAIARGSPLGSEAWQRRTARRLGLEYTLRPRGRPKKQTRD